MSIMLPLLNNIYSALDPISKIVAFYSAFSKGFDRVPHKLFPGKLNCNGVKDCFLEIPYDYLHKRKQFVRIGFTASVEREKTCGVS